MLQCCYCSKQFKYESEKRRHEQSHNPQFECEKCAKKFSFRSALKRHQKQHERTGSVKCADCGKYFRDSILLKRHVKYAHKGTYVCSECNATFSSDIALISHQKTHKPRSERRFRCSYNGCSKSFNYTHHLKHHELTHMNAKQHYCNICGKGFIQYHHLKSHIKTHSPDSWLQCTVPGCDKQFADEYARRRHILNHKNVDSASSDSNCDVSQVNDGSEQRDDILCSSCGDLVKLSSYDHHTKQCKTNREPENLSTDIKHFNATNNHQQNDTSDSRPIDVFVENKNCDNTFATRPDCDKFCDTINVFDDIKSVNKENSLERNNNAACEVCDCNSRGRDSVRTNSDVPQIEYRSNGVVKLKDTLETDIADVCKVKGRVDSDELYAEVPLNSCKSVLGKCIVSGSGTIGDGCLCAKMALDGRELLEQQMDEITPHPTGWMF